MTQNDRQQIIDYLSGPREYPEGVALYQKMGQNLRLKQTFATDSTQTTKEILFEELRKLAGLTEMEFARLPRKAASHKPALNRISATCIILDDLKKNPDDNEAALMELADSFGVTVDELVSPEFQEKVLAMDENADRIDELTEELEEARSKYSEAPEPVRKMIRFREKYPFLNSPDCPDVLKVLVADMVTSYYRYKEAHARLQTFPDEEAAATVTDCENVVTEYLKNREIWDELEYYKKTGSILGKATKFREMEAKEDFSQLSEIDLMRQLNSATANESKHRKSVNQAKEKGETNEKAEAALARWSLRKTALQEEVALRKKK